MPKPRREGSRPLAGSERTAALSDRKPAGVDRPVQPLGPGAVVRFLLVSSVTIAVMTWGWTWVGPAYNGAFRTVFDGLLSGFDVRIVTDDVSGSRDAHDALRLVIPQTTTGRAHSIPVDPRSLGYLPSVMVMALAVATPLPWKRRGRALLWGVLCAQAYVVVRVLLAWAFACCQRDALQEGAVTPWWLYVAGYTHLAVFRRNAATYLLPVLIWLGACVRMKDVRAWRGRPAVRAD